MAKNIEIERKFLVLDDSYLQLATSHVDIRQGYISRDPDRTVRIRQKGEHAYLTFKSRPDEKGWSRFEYEHEVERKDAEQLFQLCLPGMIDKTRYIVPLEGNLVVEVDVFHGDHEGLVIAEVELENMQQTFLKPAFLGMEVTGDERYYNAYLSSHSKGVNE